jgi:hypothetical protein
MDTEPTTTGPALVGRIIWMMVGPITLALLALQIVQQRHGWLTPTSIGYILVLGVTLLGRCLEVRSGSPTTVTGEPLTKDHLRRYALAAGTIGVAIWFVANLVGDQIGVH